MASVVESDPESPAGEPAVDVHAHRREEREKLRISRFDIVTSLFMALILFIGTFVTMLFIIWLTSRLSFPPRAIEPIIENPAGRGENAEGFERDFEPPGAEEVEELTEPTLQDTIEAVTDAVSSVAATLDTMNTNTSASTVGSGKGDSRPPGPMGEGEDIVPRFERWQMNYTAANMRAYASQLQFYNIELGVVGGGVQGLDIVNNLVGSPKSRRVVDAQSEKRLYFMWTSPSPLQNYERQMLQQAGVSLAGDRRMMKLIPPDLENQLATIELEYAQSHGHQSVKEIAKTIFESQPQGSGFAFTVIDQRYRKPR